MASVVRAFLLLCLAIVATFAKPPKDSLRAKMELQLIARNLPEIDFGAGKSKTHYVCVLYIKDTNTNKLNILDQTNPGLYKNKYLTWKKKLLADIVFEEHKVLVFKIYQSDKEAEKGTTYSDFDLIASVNFSVGELTPTKRNTAGNLILEKGTARHGNPPKLDIISENVDHFKEKVKLNFSANNLEAMDKGGTSDPFLKIMAAKGPDEGAKLVEFKKTETLKKTLDPKWDEISLDVIYLNNGDPSSKFRLEVWDWNRLKNQLIGYVEITYIQLCEYADTNKKFALSRPGVENSGQLAIAPFTPDFDRNFLFYRAIGLQLGFSVAIDYTESNLTHDLHHTRKDPRNDYYNCASAMVKLWGPTEFVPILEKFVAEVKKTQRDWKQYKILLILTDGAITDYEATVNLIISNSNLPMSIIIIGIGPGDLRLKINDELRPFGHMEMLDSDDELLNNGLKGESYKQAFRDIVQFVSKQKFDEKTKKASAADKLLMLTAKLLKEVPYQVVEALKIWEDAHPGFIKEAVELVRERWRDNLRLLQELPADF